MCMKDLPRGLHESGMNVILITSPNVLIIRWTNTNQPRRIIHPCSKNKTFHNLHNCFVVYFRNIYKFILNYTLCIFHERSGLICDSTDSLLCVQRTLLMWNIHGQCSTQCTCVVSLLFSLEHTHCQLTLPADCIKAVCVCVAWVVFGLWHTGHCSPGHWLLILLFTSTCLQLVRKRLLKKFTIHSV